MALSAWVRSRGVSADMVVALQLRRSLEMVVGLLGVLLSGGAYLPLDPSWPGERRQFMLQDAGCTQLIVQGDASLLSASAHLQEPMSLAATASTMTRTTCASLAYTMYTSGSTGKPLSLIHI